MKSKLFLWMIVLSVGSLLLGACGTFEMEVVQAEQDTLTATHDAALQAVITQESSPVRMDVDESPGADSFEPIRDVLRQGVGEFSERGWISLESEELQLRFEIPALEGPITYRYAEWAPGKSYDPAGALAQWTVVNDAQNYEYMFAGCVSEDFQMGRGGWPTDAVRWTRDGDRFTVLYPLGKTYDVMPLRVVAHPDGMEGIILDPNAYFFDDEMLGYLDKVDRMAILNLPEGYHPRLECMTFYFYAETSVDTIEEVLLSLELLSD